jgi:hypothetical protein
MLTVNGAYPLSGVAVIRELQLGIFHSHVALQVDHVPLLEARSHCSVPFTIPSPQ